MNQKNLLKRSALAAAVAIVSSNVYAAGFQLNEYTAAGLGRSFSGEGAIADSAASGSRNPATMTMFSRPSFSAGAVYVDPDVNITGRSPLTGNSTDADNIAPNQWIPNLHFIMPLNDKWAIGASATSNYGLATEFNDNYAAGPLGGETDLTTVNTNLSAAYRINQHFSLGLGFDAVYANAKITRTAGELGPISSHGLISPSTEVADLKGHEWGYGWNAGILYEVDDNNRYGFTYRSKVNIDFDGEYKNGIPAQLGGTGGSTVPGALTLNLPEMWEISGYNKVAPKWAVHYSLAYTSWSEFQELKATGNNGQTLFEKHEGYQDAYRIALGTTYYYDDNWTFRTGIAFDDSPVPADNRTISIPDQDRFWISAGTTYAFNKDASVDVGVSYMHGQTVNISENASPGVPNYEFQAKGTAMLYGANFNYSF
ncbi:long-chain fatty acid outer membrane transporter [Enterobacterales bacterium]|nr:long-chain fatty acid outer membrane transporter [Enterobacterales bacterium]